MREDIASLYGIAEIHAVALRTKIDYSLTQKVSSKKDIYYFCRSMLEKWIFAHTCIVLTGLMRNLILHDVAKTMLMTIGWFQTSDIISVPKTWEFKKLFLIKGLMNV